MTRHTNVQTDGLHVQYGCGTCAPDTWLNFDASPALRLQRLPLIGRLPWGHGVRFPKTVRYGDIVRGLPLRPGCCRAIYASHVLEHLALDDFQRALRNTFTLLQPAGIFRLIVPDLEILARSYLASDDDDAAGQFMRAAGIGRTTRARGIIGRARDCLGNSAHLWMWDAKSLTHELTRTGFVRVRQCEPGDSEDPLFAHVEDPQRFIDAVAIECRRL